VSGLSGVSRGSLFAVLLGGASGCASHAAPPPALDPGAFVEAAERIRAARGDLRDARTDNLRLELDAPYLAGALSARGAVAIETPDRLRMILLGPGGTTAMDLWVSGDAYRFAIPAASRVLAGSREDPPSARRGLPVDFLGWWLLDPLGGELLAARREPDALVVLLRDRERTTEATLHADGRVEAHRWTFSGPTGAELVDEEWVTATRLGCGSVVYRDRAMRLRVSVTCESSRPGANARAFAPPEAP
jgi:hypothetical protein